MTPSLLVLGLANALPIAGVLLLGWKVFPLVLLYWLENVVVGGFNVGKLLLAQPQEPVYSVGKLFLIPFFIFHFGMFTLLHGVFVFALFGAKTLPRFDSLAELPEAIRAYHLGWGLLALVLSHGLSFYWNYFQNGEYRRASLPPHDAAVRPPRRAAPRGAVRWLDRADPGLAAPGAPGARGLEDRGRRPRAFGRAAQVRGADDLIMQGRPSGDVSYGPCVLAAAFRS